MPITCPWSLRSLLAGVLLAAAALPGFTQEGTIEVRVPEASQYDGIARFRLAENPEQYDGGPEARETSRRIGDGPVTVEFSGIEPGTYALILYIDENENGELDTNFLGIPQEPFGFSTNPRVRLSRPTFDDSRFEFDGGRRVLEIELN
jgi:uncharacterized protein (DUF2141 family)